MARQNGYICVLFDQSPSGTNYVEGTYSWVPESEARRYMQEGYGQEFDPADRQVEEPEPAEPEDDYPDDFPETIKSICKQDSREFAEVQELYEDDNLQDITGVGASTETKIKNYFGD